MFLLFNDENPVFHVHVASSDDGGRIRKLRSKYFFISNSWELGKKMLFAKELNWDVYAGWGPSSLAILGWHLCPICLNLFPLSSSRCGFCYMELEHVPAGIYNVTPTTFLPKQEGPFFLDFGSTSPLKVTQLQWWSRSGAEEGTKRRVGNCSVLQVLFEEISNSHILILNCNTTVI